mgnify:CR=1 FL=1
MKTFFLTVFLSTLPFTSIVAYHEIRSALNVAEIERIHNLPVSISIPSDEIEVEFVPFFEEPRNVVCGEYTCTFTPSATVQTIDSEIEIDFIADSE